MTQTATTKLPGRFPYLGRISIGLFAALLFAMLASPLTGWRAAVGISCFIFLASGAVGGAFGFLFAVPRLLSEGSEAQTAAGAQGPAGGSAASTRLLRSNTNLERISDWLTTMLVGVGLSQVGSINAALNGFRLFIAQNARVFPDAHGGFSAGTLPAVAPMILIFGIVAGFLALYLYTRIILSGTFNRAERDLTNSEIARTPVEGAARQVLVQEAKALATTTGDPTVQAVASTRKVSVGDGLDVMLARLYEEDGYDRVIDLATQLSTSPLSRTAEYWFYLAAAFGQKHRALHGQSPEILSPVRTSALDACRRAVKIDRSFAERLWAISDPNGSDDDLADFRDDPEFRRIVRRPIRT